MIIKPNQREAFAHRHKQVEEINVVLSGEGQVKLDQELVKLSPLDVVRVSPGTTRAFEAGPKGLEVLFGARHEGDGAICCTRCCKAPSPEAGHTRGLLSVRSV